MRNDRHEKEDSISKETSNDGSDKDDEYVDNNQDNDSSQSIEPSARSSSDQDSYYCDSHGDDFDESGEDECPSNFHKWLKQNQKKVRCKKRLKLCSD